jgi:hypothetical protein
MITSISGKSAGSPPVLILGLRALFLAAALSVLAGCPTESRNAETPPNSRSFYVQRADGSGVYYRINALKLAEGNKCIVFAAGDARISARTAESITAEYDARIYPSIMGAFGDYAAQGYDVDGNGKVIILLVDIQDGYDGTGGYVAGYFDSTHMFAYSAYSNQADMLFIDVNPQTPGNSECYVNIAHELQHLINFAVHGGTSQELWLNEGLSTAAEYLYGGHQQSRVDYFNTDPARTIVYGNNFFVWNGFWEQETGDLLANYATAYLFFQWLRIHGGLEIYGAISNAAEQDYRAVTGAAKGRIPGIAETGDLEVWDQLLSSWMIANLVNAQTGLYGYQGEIVTQAHGFEDEEIQNTLFSPGEGIYSVLKNKSLSNVADSGPHIKYLGIDSQQVNPAITTVPPYTGDVLLTYNANPDSLGGEDEKGYIMSHSGGLSAPLAGTGHSASGGTLPSSYAVGIHDLRIPRPAGGAGPRWLR